MKQTKGFTLIELLVVISIIGVLLAIGTANFVTAQRQARDSNRRQLIGNVQAAMEQYYAVNGNVYPSSAVELGTAFDNNSIPVDPKNSGSYVISWNYSTTAYCICALLEAGSGNANAPGGTSCNWNSGGTYYCAANKQ